VGGLSECHWGVNDTNFIRVCIIVINKQTNKQKAVWERKTYFGIQFHVPARYFRKVKAGIQTGPERGEADADAREECCLLAGSSWPF